MRAALAALIALALPARAAADEGMWTFANLPVEHRRAAHGFAPDAAWIEHARAAASRTCRAPTPTWWRAARADRGLSHNFYRPFTPGEHRRTGSSVW
jgi:hypothetical protein